MKRDELAGPAPERVIPPDPVGGPFPVVTFALVLVNVLVFACRLAAGEASDDGIGTWGLTRRRCS